MDQPAHTISNAFAITTDPGDRAALPIVVHELCGLPWLQRRLGTGLLHATFELIEAGESQIAIDSRRIVQIIRNPLSIWADIRRTASAAGRWSAALQSPLGSTLQRAWISDVACEVLPVRIEDFVAFPSVTLHRIERFFQLPIDPRRSQQLHASERPRQRVRLADDTAVGLDLFGWLDELGASEAAEVYSRCSDGIRRFYPELLSILDTTAAAA